MDRIIFLPNSDILYDGVKKNQIFQTRYNANKEDGKNGNSAMLFWSLESKQGLED